MGEGIQWGATASMTQLDRSILPVHLRQLSEAGHDGLGGLIDVSLQTSKTVKFSPTMLCNTFKECREKQLKTA